LTNEASPQTDQLNGTQINADGHRFLNFSICENQRSSASKILTHLVEIRLMKMSRLELMAVSDPEAYQLRIIASQAWSYYHSPIGAFSQLGLSF